MIKTKVGKHNVTLYDSIEDLPVVRFNKYNKCLLLDAGIGSDLSDVDNHIEKAIAYARSKTPEKGAIELENLRQNIYAIQSGLSPKHLAFASLVTEIDGVRCDDLSDDGLRKVVDILGDAKHTDLADLSVEVKKKIDSEMHAYFPRVGDDAEEKEYYDKLRKRTLLLLDDIIEGKTKERAKQIEAITTELLLSVDPMKFTGDENAEILHDKKFEKMCLLLSKELHVKPKEMTVLEFYNAFEYLKEITDEQKKHLKVK